MTNQPDYSLINTLPEIWTLTAEKFKDIVALEDPHSTPNVSITYGELYQNIKDFAAGLQSLGIKSSSQVALVADNSPRWFIADQGSMMAGAANVVRSAQADKDELLYILSDSNSSILIVENQQTLAKLRSDLNRLPIELIILLSDEQRSADDIIKILNFQELMELGSHSTLKPVHQTKETLATLIYTSGTTGRPKGVMLCHRNLLHQVVYLEAVIQPRPGERVLAILPSWHAYERSTEYFILSRGCILTYTNIRTFKADLIRFKPQHMVGVPRLWEFLYEGIQKQFRKQSSTQQKIIQFFLTVSEQYIIARRIANNLSLDHLKASSAERLLAKIKTVLLTPLHRLADKLIYSKIRQEVGGNLRTIVSGGGSLARHIDTFYEIINIPLLVGYGLTETAPVTNVRTHSHNLRGSSGQCIPETEVCIVDPDSGQPVPQGERGLVLIRGTQVMQGYYKNPEATAKAINDDNWFNSGDLGWLTDMGDLVITGRDKDTIVLSNGENIEPQAIEEACTRSPYIDQIILVGQDQKALGALIVPNLEALNKWGQNQQITLNLPDMSGTSEEIVCSDLYSQPIQTLFREELGREVKNRPGYRPDDKIKSFKFILEPFSRENGLMTQTFKIKRQVVIQQYQGMIDEIFDYRKVS
ncbi:AMP-binding protein [cyanobacterium endosymbiont of Epithemia turgida]|uniref:AMP-binding protein n=1 Tax=cyanobacterium endosymbiont of Epithemia turgida TaxID=718217 RepID=UPI0004D15F55|nr:AMP-binding protein [cyanobacterium endosymbiont of Epithemia turgida]BAP17565.1 long-chain-fatty-acid CoA ligase [cyanobacterium endosymbiont of Epithemia turgida isolate EtSB Lake Yunoko]